MAGSQQHEQLAGGSRLTLSQVPRRSFGSCLARFLPPARIRGLSFATSSFVLQFGNLHKVVGKYRGADPQLKPFASLGKAALHAATAKQYGNAPLDPSAKALPFFKGWALFVRFAFGSSLAPTLRDTRHLDAASRARLDILLTKEASICTIQPTFRTLIAQYLWGVAPGWPG